MALQKVRLTCWIAPLLFGLIIGQAETVAAETVLAETVAATPRLALEQLKVLFKRPSALTAPSAGAEQVALGDRLFHEKKLSADQTMSCATCHNPARSFMDGRRTARGRHGRDLPRNTPAIWNIGSARLLYWDGRVSTLEEQIRDAIERDGEMAGTLTGGVLRLSRDPTYLEAFQRAFGGPTALSADNLLTAMASYERSLHSPDTRFDRWVNGDENALSKREIAGLRIFAGKGRCLACHGGWRFTDDGFHDVGLRSLDQGRSAIVGGPGRTFKTPSLREVVWTAPYMHDGSLRTLHDVVAHYAGTLDRRASLAPELKRGIELSKSERSDLVSFLKSLSGETRSRPPAMQRQALPRH
jgi:cytochrome c peroxidase